MTSIQHSPNRNALNVRIASEGEGMSLETYLRRELHFSKAQIRQMKFQGDGLRIGGERVRVTVRLHAGDVLEIPLRESADSFTCLEDSSLPLDILYEDEDVIAVWKTAGIPVHPSGGHYRDTLSNAVQTHLRGKGRNITIRSIGRLDKDTSGIVVFACSQTAAARLWEQKDRGVFTKEYLALCEGVFSGEAKAPLPVFHTLGGDDFSKTAPWHTICSPIGKVSDDSIRMCVSSDGKKAVTHYQIVSELPAGSRISLTDNETALIPCSLIRVRIETGRTHQIRVHMASIGHPLYGDPLYGSGKTGTSGAQLCAWKAEFLQPFTGMRICLNRCPEFPVK